MPTANFGGAGGLHRRGHGVLVGELDLVAGVRARDRRRARTPRGRTRSVVAGYDAVVIGGALYANRWHVGARRFVAWNIAELRRVPVWMFSSGPLGATAERDEIPPAITLLTRARHSLTRARHVPTA